MNYLPAPKLILISAFFKALSARNRSIPSSLAAKRASARYLALSARSTSSSSGHSATSARIVTESPRTSAKPA